MKKVWYVCNKYDLNDTEGPFDTEEEAIGVMNDLNTFETYMVQVDDDEEMV